jgi:hypothetical protein
MPQNSDSYGLNSLCFSDAETSPNHHSAACINNANARKKCGAIKSISNSIFYHKF